MFNRLLHAKMPMLRASSLHPAQVSTPLSFFSRRSLQGAFWLLSAFALCVGGCQRTELPPAISSTAKAIINGAQDITNPAIGALTRRSGNSYAPFCTGTLLTGRLVVTAAHCVEDITSQNVGSFRFRVDTPEADGVTFKTAYYELEEALTHPRYSRSVPAQTYSDYDVAIWILKTAVPNVTPVPLNRASIPQAWLGTNLKLVGYGQIQTQPQRVSAPSKQSAMIPLDEIRPRSFRHWDKVTKKSVCNGDSGGPALYTVNGVEYILGVSSVVEGATPDPQSNLTLCDAAGVSTRLDMNLEFLEPFLKRYADNPATCTTDAECGTCGTCQQGSCGAATVNTTTYCKPCSTDTDCGGDAKCLRTNEGFRCVQPCNDNTCYQCPTGGVCQTTSGGGATAVLSCRPVSGVCPPASCQSASDCGPAELCENGTCKIDRPTPIPQLCRPCKTSQDCGTGFCLEPENGLGYCVQGCGTGDYCPDGFECLQLTPGTKQCIPQEGCFMRCDDVSPCPSGYTCGAGFCQRDGGGKDGDFCKTGFNCAPGYSCLSEDSGSGRCALNCAPNGTVAGNACGTNRTCDAGLTCFGTRTLACMQGCTNVGQACAGGGTCTSVQSNITACVCRSDSDCGAEQFCNINRWGSLGIGGCVAKSKTPPACPATLTCRSASGTKACLPEDGDQRAGAVCSRTLRCAPGLACYNFDGTPRCMEPCSGSALCSNGGACTDFGNGLNLCICQRDQDCGLGRQCHLVLADQGVGVCGPALGAGCNADKECPANYACNAGACVASNNPTEPSAEPASEPSTEPIAEQAVEPSAEPTVDSVSEPIVSSEETTSDAGAPEKTETAPETQGELTINTAAGGCGCSSSEQPMGSVGFLFVFLVLLSLRRRTA
ncbi:MAG: trypsin-like serine protease [Myxococcales bacterium]|nr:trypsin-like serine protease [Myxococcales bacterium]MCB9643244.1 trypsin-like serine protease [Myxococcales bacterium]